MQKIVNKKINTYWMEDIVDKEMGYLCKESIKKLVEKYRFLPIKIKNKFWKKKQGKFNSV